MSSSANPMNAADVLSVGLVILGLIFIYVGYTQGEGGYTAVGLIEILFAMIQSYINRM